MPKIQYITKRFAGKSEAIIERANEILSEYRDLGYVLTLRQLYYQFVSRDWIPNTQGDYKRLGKVISDARLAGRIDWDAIEDRTRNLEALPHWSSPADILEACAQSFNVDLWQGQDRRVEVWVEKDALAGIFERACSKLDVAWMSTRGYGSQSEIWRAARRHLRYEADGATVTVLHFGDHDPSGIDMTRDIADRLKLFGTRTVVHRVALTMEQVREHNPPPNPAKITDSRFEGYVQEFGDECWELDALKPQVLERLIKLHVVAQLNTTTFDERKQEQTDGRQRLQDLADDWAE